MLALVLAGMAGAASAMAQNAATANITADVQQPVTVTKSADLIFGTVFPGSNKTIAVTAAGAAAFTVTGQASAAIDLTFTLPTTIANGGSTMPLGSWTGAHNIVNTAVAGTSFTPSASATSTTLSVLGARYVFIGATAQPSVSQTAGTYSGSFTMTVVYP